MLFAQVSPAGSIGAIQMTRAAGVDGLMHSLLKADVAGDQVRS